MVKNKNYKLQITNYIFQKYYFLFFLICNLQSAICNSLSAQQVGEKYWLQFTDKKNTSFSFSNPEKFLSQRAIGRRKNQNINITENDFPVNSDYIDSVVKSGVLLLNKSKWLNGITVEIIDSTALSKIKKFPFVFEIKFIKPVTMFKKENQEINNKFGWKNENDFLNNTNESPVNYGNSFNQIKMLAGNQLHDLGFRGQGKIIAVLDAGFWRANEIKAFDSLRANNQILGTWDFVKNEVNVYDDDSHGMFVLSLMGGHLEEKLIGTAPKANFWLLRSEDARSEYLIEEYNWVAAAEFADSVGADIINSSLGYSEFNDTTQNHSYNDLNGNTTVVTKGADIAASKGILVVNSAGNEAQTSWKQIIAPADGDSVLAVGAVDSLGKYAAFSSLGLSSDNRIKPNVAAQGEAVTLARDSGIFNGSGTSFSSPIIAGMAACLWQAHPEKTNMEIINAIQQSANQFNKPDKKLGYGIPNFSVAYYTLSEHKKTNEVELLQIFPNPFKDDFEFAVSPNSKEEIAVQIFDFNGKNIYKFSETKINVIKNYRWVKIENLDFMSAGVYKVSIKIQSEKFVRTIVKY